MDTSKWGKNIVVGEKAKLGDGVILGHNCIIGAGSLILSDVPDNSTVVGVWRGKNKQDEHTDHSRSRS